MHLRHCLVSLCLAFAVVGTTVDSRVFAQERPEATPDVAVSTDDSCSRLNQAARCMYRQRPRMMRSVAYAR